ncbi:hypothetical protein COL447_18020 [Helicobacter pylori]
MDTKIVVNNITMIKNMLINQRILVFVVLAFSIIVTIIIYLFCYKSIKNIIFQLNLLNYPHN